MIRSINRSARSLGLTIGMCVLVQNVVFAVNFEDFQFNDANGTTLDMVSNSGTIGSEWDVDSDNLTNSSVLNGSYRIQKDNDGFATNFLPIENITSGKAWVIADFAGWNFATGTANTADYNPSELEEIRFSFLDNDPGGQGDSTVTAEVRLARSSTGGLELFGRALGSGSNINSFALPSVTQSQPFSLVMELDKTANRYEIFFDDSSGGGFTSIGSGDVDPARNGNSLRFSVNNNFSGTGEFVDLDRLVLTNDNPVTVPTDKLTLEVNTTTGGLSILNDSPTPFDINSYRITSSTDDLNFAGWNSFSAQAIDAIDGIDGDLTVGNGIGETWDEAGGSSNSVLAESFLQGSSLFGNGRSETLGNAFQVGGDTDSLVFQYRSASNGAIFDGQISLVSGGSADADDDGDIDGQDFLLLQRTDPGLIALWQQQYGALQAITQSVPEPTTAGLLVLAAAVLLANYRT